MRDEGRNSNVIASPGPSRREEALHPYSSPSLTALGDLRGLTFGGSPGLNDSGALMTQEPPV